MAVSEATKKQIEEFSREQAHHYLDRAELTYWEKLHDKAERTRRKVSRKAARFKSRSDQSIEAQGDRMVYMNDFVEDLMSKGASEAEAFEQARSELVYDSGSERAADVSEQYVERYFDFPGCLDGSAFGGERGNSDRGALYAAIGMYYSGSVLVSCILGAAVGLAVGMAVLDTWFWVGPIVGLVAGAVFGVGVAMLLHARALRGAASGR
ncbi:MAG: hypothetical protein LBD25_08560 [Coriobacteriales bacterium]|jgi:hypothetical protein|nr:hypothetical protein [Coriobacteriales bacterium]